LRKERLTEESGARVNFVTYEAIELLLGLSLLNGSKGDVIGHFGTSHTTRGDALFCPKAPLFAYEGAEINSRQGKEL
jgi:hypothetical protein